MIASNFFQVHLIVFMFALSVVLKINQVTGSSVTSGTESVQDFDLNTSFLSKWYEAEERVKKFYSHFALEIILPTLRSAMKKTKVSVVCEKSLEFMMQDAAKLKKWAIQGKQMKLFISSS